MGSNLISLVISMLITLVVPKLIGDTGYGYFQLYIFYSAYIGFFHLGWCDGIYLKYGGEYYDRLDKPKMSAQFWLLTVFEAVVTAILFAAIFIISPESERGFVLMLTVFSIIIVIPKTMLSYLLQLSNRIKEYSIVTVSEKLIYCVVVIAVLAVGIRDFRYLIWADVIGKLVSFVISVIYCRDIVRTKAEPIRAALSEAWSNISIGVKLMVANVAGMLILGIVRLAIENHWSIEIFGKVSLSLSVSNLMMVFVSAIGIVLFPMLKRIDSDKLQGLYSDLRGMLMFPLLGLLILFYPVRAVLSVWLPNYAESMSYMALLFPICIFDSKMSMLINTYMKALRLENKLLMVNSITVVLSLVFTFISVYVCGSLELAVLSISVLFGFRCTFSEYLLSKRMELKIFKNMIEEIVMVALFVALNWFIDGPVACIVYLAFYLIYVVINKKQLSALVKKMRSALTGKKA